MYDVLKEFQKSNIRGPVVIDRESGRGLVLSSLKREVLVK